MPPPPSPPHLPLSHLPPPSPLRSSTPSADSAPAALAPVAPALAAPAPRACVAPRLPSAASASDARASLSSSCTIQGKHTRHPRAKAASTKASRSTSLCMDCVHGHGRARLQRGEVALERMARLSAAVRPLRSGYPVAHNQRFRSYLLLFVHASSIAVRVADGLEQGVVR